MKLITEQVQDVEILKEEDEKSGKKNYKLKGIFLQGDIKNRNGRIYPVEVLEKEVDRYNKEFIAENRGYGELGHPEARLSIWKEYRTWLHLSKEMVKTSLVKQKLCQHQWVKLYLILWTMVVNSQSHQEVWVVCNKRMVQTM